MRRRQRRCLRRSAPAFPSARSPARRLSGPRRASAAIIVSQHFGWFEVGAAGALFFGGKGETLASTHTTERELQRQIARTVESGLPQVEVLAVELMGPGPLLRLRRPPGGRRPRALRDA